MAMDVVNTGNLDAGSNIKVALTNTPALYVALLARNIGVVTTTGAITIVAAFDAYWE